MSTKIPKNVWNLILKELQYNDKKDRWIKNQNTIYNLDSVISICKDNFNVGVKLFFNNGISKWIYFRNLDKLLQIQNYLRIDLITLKSF